MSKSQFSFKKGIFTLMLVLLLVLAACGGNSNENNADDSAGNNANTEENANNDANGNNNENDNNNDDGNNNNNAENEEEAADGDIYSIDDFNMSKENDGEAIDGGMLNFGLVTDSPFNGTLNWTYYDGAPDAEILDWFDESLLGMDSNYQFTQDGAATFEVSDDGHEFTFTIHDDVNWHDGEPVTAEDWAYSYEVIGHEDYKGVRYGSDFTIIEGMEAYHDGEADDISGIEIVDDKVLKITFEQATPSLLSGGIWTYAMPKHIFEDIPVADHIESDAVRKNPVGMGPFKVDVITPGESVTYTANEDYWRGEPSLDGVTLRVIDPTVVVNELETGAVDMVDSFPTDQYPDNADMANIEYLGEIDAAYTYIGFKLGDWDFDNKKVNYKADEMKMGDVELRRAMWYAVDNDAVGEKFYNGLRWAGTTLIPPSHPDFHDESIEAPTFDEDKANQILDDAGYEYDGDFRTDKEGNELVINFASMSGGDTAEPLADYYIQSWNKVGLNVELLDGRLMSFDAFYEAVGQHPDEQDSTEVDVYQGAWGVGSDVDPAGLYGPVAKFNFPRYENEENDRLLEEGVSEDSFDAEHRQEVYKEWQELMVEEVPVFPTLYRSILVPINNRVVNWTLDADEELYRYEVGLTQDEPLTVNDAE